MTIDFTEDEAKAIALLINEVKKLAPLWRALPADMRRHAQRGLDKMITAGKSGNGDN